jgi:nucleoside-diphosphate-sugar epimerase
MYEIAEYTSVNADGTGVLLEALAADRCGSCVASSMSVYDEGRYVGNGGRRD